MDEQAEKDEQSQGLQGAAPLLLSVAAGAAAGALAVVARKALSDRGGDDEETVTEESGERSTAFDDLEQVADDLDGLVAQLRSESHEDPDFGRLVVLADTISEYADQAANAFHEAATSGTEGEELEGRVTDELMSRIAELTRREREPARR
jgi:hypothetical protein